MLTDIQLIQVRNAANHILHVPGNYTGGILEVALVCDMHMSISRLQEESIQIFDTLRKQNEVFRNIRLNVVKWYGDEHMEKEISSVSALIMKQVFKAACNDSESIHKKLDIVISQLKLFYARSKLIFLLTDGSYQIEDINLVKQSLQPFLGRKLLVIKEGKILPIPLLLQLQ